MFELSADEFTDLRNQFGTSSRGGIRYRPMAFTEHGAIMVASVLNSQRAIDASVNVVRAFVRLREMLVGHKELAAKLVELENHLTEHDEQFRVVFEALKRLLEADDERPKKKIGF